MTMKIHILSRAYTIILVLATFLAAFSLLLLLTSLSAEASAVTITDQAGVLDTGRVLTEARKLNNPVVIFTTRTFGGDQEALNQAAREQLPTQDAIAIEVDVTHRHLSIQSGQKAKLSNEQASDAVSAFRGNFHEGDYTGATIAALDSVQDALNGGGGSSSLSTVGAIVAFLLIAGTLGLVFFIAFYWKRPPRSGGRGFSAHTYHHSSVYHGGSHYTGGSYGGGRAGASKESSGQSLN